MLLPAMTQYTEQITRQHRRFRRDHVPGVFHRKQRAYRPACECGDPIPTFLTVCRPCSAEALQRDLDREEANRV